MRHSELERIFSRAGQAVASFAAWRAADLAEASRLLATWRPLYEQHAAAQAPDLDAAERVLAALRKSGLGRFDLLRIARFLPDEDTLSDILAAVLNPRQGHGLGTRPLQALLLAVRGRRRLAKRHAIRIDRLLRLVEEDAGQITVIRERNEQATRPDIAVFGPSFALFIENKRRGGRETPHPSGLGQTERQQQALERRAQRLGLAPETDVLGVLLSPEGHRASSAEFVPLTCVELAGSLRRVLPEGAPEDHVLAAVSAFLTFYELYEWS